LLCSDRADQKFLDLAISVAAHALISKDRPAQARAQDEGLDLAVVPPEAASRPWAWWARWNRNVLPGADRVRREVHRA